MAPPLADSIITGHLGPEGKVPEVPTHQAINEAIDEKHRLAEEDGKDGAIEYDFWRLVWAVTVLTSTQ